MEDVDKDNWRPCDEMKLIISKKLAGRGITDIAYHLRVNRTNLQNMLKGKQQVNLRVVRLFVALGADPYVMLRDNTVDPFEKLAAKIKEEENNVRTRHRDKNPGWD